MSILMKLLCFALEYAFFHWLFLTFKKREYSRKLDVRTEHLGTELERWSSSRDAKCLRVYRGPQHWSGDSKAPITSAPGHSDASSAP